MLKVLNHIKRVISYKKYALLLKLLKNNIDSDEKKSSYIIKIIAFLDKENVFMFLRNISIETLEVLLNTKAFYYRFRKKLDFKMLLDTTKDLEFHQVYTIFSKYYNYHCYKQFFDDLIKFRMTNYIISNLAYITKGVTLDVIISNLKSIKYELSES